MIKLEVIVIVTYMLMVKEMDLYFYNKSMAAADVQQTSTLGFSAQSPRYY